MSTRLFQTGLALVFVCWISSTSFAQVTAEAPDSGIAVQTDSSDVKLKVLIVDGQNNHDAWPKSTFMMKSFLEETGKFEVDIYRSKFTWRGTRFGAEFQLNDGKAYEDLNEAKADPDFNPQWSDYDVVVSNFGFGAADWPKETQVAFENYMADGGGFVSIHAADNSFPTWREYNEMIGLGGWGGRTEANGPYVYFNTDNELVRDDSEGKTGDHGPQHEFPIVIRDSEHPITKGLPPEFMHTKDELYQQLRGPGANMTILATAFAAPDKQGTGRHEPSVMTLDYKKGRVFHATIGHEDYSFECVGFITLFQRGTEWAATGSVTLPVPEDFPTATASKSRTFESAKSAAE